MVGQKCPMDDGPADLPDFWLWLFLLSGCRGRTCWTRMIWSSLWERSVKEGALKTGRCTYVSALVLVLGPTAGLGRGLVPPGVVELAVLLLRQAEPLLLHLVDLLLGAEGVADHRQVVPQHALLLPLPLDARVLQLGAL